MRKLLFPALICLFTMRCAAGALSERPIQYVVGTTADLTETEAKLVAISGVRLVLGSNPGDLVRFIDAETQAPIAAITVPNASERATVKIISGEIAKVVAYLKAHGTGSEAPGRRVHLPNFLDTVSRMADPEFEETRAVVFGSAFFGDGSDARFDFSAGAYPSPGHAFASSKVTVYGAADKSPMQNTRLDFFNMTPIEDDIHRRHIQEWWTLYSGERGVTLTSWQEMSPAPSSFDTVVGEAVKDLDAPMLNITPDRRDLRREILRVDGGLSRPNIWSLVIVVDCSASMQSAFEEIRREIPLLAADLYEAGAEIRVSIIPYRARPLTPFPLTTVRSSGSDGGKSLARLNRYLDGVRVVSEAVDPAAALRAGLAALEQDRDLETFSSLILVGDTRSETGTAAEAEGRLINELRQWYLAGPGRSLHTVLLGSADEGSRAFFNSAAGAGDQTIAGDFATVADRVVEQAADVTRGLDMD